MQAIIHKTTVYITDKRCHDMVAYDMEYGIAHVVCSQRCTVTHQNEFQIERQPKKGSRESPVLCSLLFKV